MTRYGHITEIWPKPPVTLAERLRQTLDIWADCPDDFVILIATSEVYGPHVVTGLTVGDLKELYDAVQGTDAAVQLCNRLREAAGPDGLPPGDPEGG